MTTKDDTQSNTMNLFSDGSAKLLQKWIAGLLGDAAPDSGPDGEWWNARAITFIGALVKPLVYLRDAHQHPLDAQVMSMYFDLSEIERLVYKLPVTYPELDNVLDELKNYLATISGYDKTKSPAYWAVYGHRGPKPAPTGQSAQAIEEHGFISMQLSRLFRDAMASPDKVSAQPC